MQPATQTWNLAGHFYANILPPALIPSVAPVNARRIFASGTPALVDGRTDFFGCDLPKIRPSIQNARYDWSRQLDAFAADMVIVKPGARLATELRPRPSGRSFR
jgi:hypothetical protein